MCSAEIGNQPAFVLGVLGAPFNPARIDEFEILSDEGKS